VGVQVNCEIPREHVPYLSASEVMFHEEALYQVYALPSPLSELQFKLLYVLIMKHVLHLNFQQKYYVK